MRRERSSDHEKGESRELLPGRHGGRARLLAVEGAMSFGIIYYFIMSLDKEILGGRSARRMHELGLRPPDPIFRFGH